MITMWW